MLDVKELQKVIDESDLDKQFKAMGWEKPKLVQMYSLRDKLQEIVDYQKEELRKKLEGLTNVMETVQHHRASKQRHAKDSQGSKKST